MHNDYHSPSSHAAAQNALIVAQDADIRQLRWALCRWRLISLVATVSWIVTLFWV